MVAFIANTPLQTAQTPVIKCIPEAASEQTTNLSKVPETVPATVAELTELATQIAQVDKMMADIAESAPEEGTEAKRWHDISVQALRMSRDSLSKKQAQCFEKLGTMIGLPPGLGPCLEEAKMPEPALEAPAWMGWSKAQVQACAEFVPTVQPVAENGSLRNDLELLRQKKPGCVVIVRKIKKLGFESQQVLEEHFSQYGSVSDILVAHSHVKPTPKRPNGRMRPAALGFVVMSSVEDVQRVLQAGSMQVVQDVNVEVDEFSAFDGVDVEAEK